MKHVRISLRWDDIENLATQTVTVTKDELSLERWNRIDLRLDPLLTPHSFTLYEASLLAVTFELVDSLGRKLTR